MTRPHSWQSVTPGTPLRVDAGLVDPRWRGEFVPCRAINLRGPGQRGVMVTLAVRNPETNEPTERPLWVGRLEYLRVGA